MLNPIRLVNDLFDDRELFDPALRAFTEDHLTRLTQPENNPGGLYNALISATTTAYNTYYGKITSEATKKSIAEGTTITRNNARKAVEEKISSLRNLVVYKYQENSAVYQEFYPLGMDEYYKAREGDIGTLFDRYLTIATNYLNFEYPAEVTALTNLIAAFHSAYEARETAVAQVDITGSGKRADRKVLTLQLTTNFLTIAIQNLEDPDRFDDYYDPRYLPLAEGPRVYNGIINPGTIINAVPEGIITRSSDLYIKNTGPDSLIFSISQQSGVIDPVHQVQVSAGQEYRFTEPLPPFNTFFLNIQNTSPNENGSYRIEVA